MEQDTWCTLREALTRFQQVYGSERALSALHDALIGGALVARAGRVQQLGTGGEPHGFGIGPQEIEPMEWLQIAIDVPQQGQAVHRLGRGERRYYDVRILRDGLEGLLGLPAQATGEPVRRGRPMQQARFEAAVHVALAWHSRPADEQRSATTKMIEIDVAAALKRSEADAPGSTVTVIATAIRKGLRASLKRTY